MRTLSTLLILALVGGGLWFLLSEPDGDVGLPSGAAEGTPGDDPGAGAPETKPADDTGEHVPSERFDDNEKPVESEPDAVPKLTILVQDASGAPTSGATVVLAEGGNPSAPAYEEGVLFPQGVTGTDGRVVIEAPIAVVWAVVVAPGYPPAHAVLVDDAVTVVELADGASVEGVVTVGGRVVEEPVELELHGFHDPSADWTLPQHAALARAGYERTATMTARTDDAGRFVFHGLEVGAALTLRFPFHEVVGGSGRDGREFGCAPPATALRIDLTASPVITGRPVGHDGVLNVKAIVTPRSGGVWIARADHRRGEAFRIVLHSREAKQAEVLITRPGGSRFARRIVVAGLDGAVDLGDIPADPMRVLPVHVTGPSGNIAGARATTAGYVSEPTGDDGWVDFQIPVGSPTVVVGAAGHHVEEVRVPPVQSGGLEVRLRAANALRVVVDGPGALDGSLELEIRHPKGGLFERPSTAGVLSEVRGTQVFDRGPVAETGGGWQRCYMRQGGVAFYGVRPDTPLSLRLSDTHGNELARETVTVGPDEQRTVTWRIPERARALSARVVDTAGNPVPGAEIRIGRNRMLWEADDQGRAVIGGIFADRVDVTASKAGFGAVTRKDVLLVEEVTFTLTPARVLWVTVTDANGKPVDDAFVEVLVDGEQVARGHRTGRGLYAVHGAPRRVVVVRVRASGDTREETVGAATDRIEVTVK